jgi:undecaprenyl-diphosphatase
MNNINHQRSGQPNLIRISRVVVPAILVSLFLVLAEILEDLFPRGVQTVGSVGPSPLVTWDKAAFLLVNVELSSPLLDLMMRLISHLGSTVFWLGAVALLAYKRRRREAFLLLVALSLDTALITSLKLLLSRVRPYQVISEARVLDREGGFSFPSGHSEASFLSATFLAAKFPRTLPFLYGLTFAIAYSRIYVGAHWPLDVVAGAIVGLTVAALILLFEKQILRAMRFQ